MAFSEKVLSILDEQYNKTPAKATTKQLYDAVSKAAMLTLRKDWKETPGQKRACYLSAEFLIGRLVYANLRNLGLLDECKALFEKEGIEIAKREGKFKGGQVKQIDDAAFNAAYEKYKNRELNKTQFAAALKISRPTLDKLLKDKGLQ